MNISFLSVQFLLWDYDDTLGETEVVALGSACDLTNKMLTRRKHRHRYDREEFIDRFPGTTYAKILSVVGGELKIEFSPAEVEQLVAFERQAAIVALSEHLRPTPGVNELLAVLQHKFTQAVVSSSSSERLEVCLKKANQQSFFGERVYSAQSSLPKPISKPDPAIYNFAMTQLGAAPHLCLAIEDSPSGVKSAVAAKVPTVGYVGALKQERRNERALRLIEAGAIAVVESWEEFQKLLLEDN